MTVTEPWPSQTWWTQSRLVVAAAGTALVTGQWSLHEAGPTADVFEFTVSYRPIPTEEDGIPGGLLSTSKVTDSQ